MATNLVGNPVDGRFGLKVANQESCESESEDAGRLIRPDLLKNSPTSVRIHPEATATGWGTHLLHEILREYKIQEDKMAAEAGALDRSFASQEATRMALAATGVVVWEWTFGEDAVLWGEGLELVYGRPREDVTFEIWRSSSMMKIETGSTT